jgi:uncharacterized membrane protein YgcG
MTQTPVIIVNFKTYSEVTGQEAVKLAKSAEKLAKETGASFVVVFPRTTNSKHIATGQNKDKNKQDIPDKTLANEKTKQAYERYRPKFEENTLFLRGAIAYWFAILVVFVTSAVIPPITIVLMISALIIIYYFHLGRKHLEMARDKEIQEITKLAINK